jgi:hypothetical protein
MYRTLVLLAVACLLSVVSVLYAQTGTIRGRVVNKQGQPVVGANVTLLRFSQTRQQTDTTGTFSFVGVPAEKDTLHIVGVGYREFVKPVEICSDTEIVVEAVLKSGLRFEEDGYGFIRQPCDTKPGCGTVFLYAADRESEKGLPNATVVLSSEYEDSAGVTHHWCCMEGETDSTGYIKICSLQPGLHEIGITLNGYAHEGYTQIVEVDSTYTHRFRLKRQ